MSILPSQPSKEIPRKREAVSVDQEVAKQPLPEEQVEEQRETEGDKGGQEGTREEKVEIEEPVAVDSEASAPLATPVAIASQKDVLTKQIESILEEDVMDLYLSMTPQDQQVFKTKGEETLSKIRVLLTKTKVNAKKIFQLIREWLKMIPGVNRFFLEQEAKIKTDKILLASEQDKH